jgi:geranylgeranylglycerol-phosphate geranylgeranyltransferase
MRLDASAVIFFSIFLPTLSRSGSVIGSLEKAAPMLFAAFCTWIANDIDDRDRDRINHPDRPLASGAITPDIAATLFFGSLAAALITTYRFIEASLAFWYYLVIILSLSYGYVVELIPTLKAPYVAATMTIPTLIMVKSYDADLTLRYVSAGVFCFALGKEACMDLVDRPGDTPSLLHKVSSTVVARTAFLILAAGILFLLPCLHTPIDVLYLLGMAALFLFAVVLWFQQERHALAIQLLRVELLLGLYFLL